MNKAKNMSQTMRYRYMFLVFCIAFVIVGITALLAVLAEDTSTKSVPVGPLVSNSVPSFKHNTQSDIGILFAAKGDLATTQIFRADLDGKNKKQLTNDLNTEHEWSRPSPDGKRILFMKAAKGSSVNFATNSNRLWIMDVDGTNQREIVGTAKRDRFGWTGMAHAEWSPDSSKIVLVATLPNLTSQLFVIDANGDNPEQITKTTNIDGHNSVVADPSWSQSNHIIFIRSWNCIGICEKQDVFSMDYSTRKETRVTTDDNWNFDPYLSPDGKTYLWLSFRSSNIICPCDLMKGNASGALVSTAVIADGGSNSNGTFSLSGEQILFLKQVGNKQVLHRINSDGTGLLKIGSGESGVASFIPSPVSTTNTNTNTDTSSTSPLGGIEAPQLTFGFNWSQVKYYIQVKWKAPTGNDSNTTYKLTQNNTVIYSGKATNYMDFTFTPNVAMSYKVIATKDSDSTESKPTKATVGCLWLFCGLTQQ